MSIRSVTIERLSMVIYRWLHPNVLSHYLSCWWLISFEVYDLISSQSMNLFVSWVFFAVSPSRQAAQGLVSNGDEICFLQNDCIQCLGHSDKALPCFWHYFIILARETKICISNRLSSYSPMQMTICERHFEITPFHTNLRKRGNTFIFCVCGCHNNSWDWQPCHNIWLNDGDLCQGSLESQSTRWCSVIECFVHMRSYIRHPHCVWYMANNGKSIVQLKSDDSHNRAYCCYMTLNLCMLVESQQMNWHLYTSVQGSYSILTLRVAHAMSRLLKSGQSVRCLVR